MTGYITLGNEKRGLTANGLSPVIFRKVFKKDFLTGRVENQHDSGALVDLYSMMAFIMAKQYELPQAELFKLTEEDYFAFLSCLGAADIENSVEQIHAIYEGNEAALSDPKDAAV